MSGFKSTDVDYDVIGDIVDELVNLLHYELGDIYFSIKNDIIPGLAPYWQGTAMETFEQGHAELVNDYWDLFGGFSDLMNVLNHAGIEYRMADEFAKQTVAELPE